MAFEQSDWSYTGTYITQELKIGTLHIESLALRGGILHVVSRCYALNQLGNAMSDPTAFKIPQVPSSILTVLGLYSQSFRILNAVESSVALSNYYIVVALLVVIMTYHFILLRSCLFVKAFYIIFFRFASLECTNKRNEVLKPH